MTETKDLYADALIGISSQYGVVTLTFGKFEAAQTAGEDGNGLKDPELRGKTTVTMPLPAFLNMTQIIPKALSEPAMKDMITRFLKAGLLVGNQSKGASDAQSEQNEQPEKKSVSAKKTKARKAVAAE